MRLQAAGAPSPTAHALRRAPSLRAAARALPRDDFLLILAHGPPNTDTRHPLDGADAARPGELANAAAPAADLACFFFARLAMLMPERDRQRHTYVLGKSGSGKSELLKLLVYGYLRKPGSATVVVIDPHGDLAEEIARFKEHRSSDRLIYIDPYLDGSGGRMPTINPFALRDTGPQATQHRAHPADGGVADPFEQR